MSELQNRPGRPGKAGGGAGGRRLSRRALLLGAALLACALLLYLYAAGKRRVVSRPDDTGNLNPIVSGAGEPRTTPSPTPSPAAPRTPEGRTRTSR